MNVGAVVRNYKKCHKFSQGVTSCKGHTSLGSQGWTAKKGSQLEMTKVWSILEGGNQFVGIIYLDV